VVTSISRRNPMKLRPVLTVALAAAAVALAALAAAATDTTDAARCTPAPTRREQLAESAALTS